MSYDIYIKNPKTNETVLFEEPHQLTGGTFCIGGTRYAHLNITYNYAFFFYNFIDTKLGIRSLYGKKVQDVIKILTPVIEKLGTRTEENYWLDTPGNAGKALQNLVDLMKMCPEDSIVEGD